MSLILEALKKSEQQRRLGEAPTLASPIVGMKRRRNVLPVLGLLIVAAAIAGWWLMRGTPKPAPAPVASTTAPATPAKPPATRERTPPPPMRRTFNEPAAQQKQARPAPPAAAATKPAAPPATAESMPAATRPLPSKGEPAKPATTPVQTPTGAAAPPKPAATEAKPATPVAKPATAGPSLPMIWELPYSTRKDLPAIEMTMHVFAADPAERFVVIKGERYVEGDDIADGLTLSEIRRDGIVLEYKGKRFLYPRGGR